VRGFYQSIAAALPDLRIEVQSEYDVPGCSIREVVISGPLDRTEKIKELAIGMAETLLTRKCELRELRSGRLASLTVIASKKTM
jgi:hypothetical protein